MANPKGNPQNLVNFKPVNSKAFDAGIYLKLYSDRKQALKSIPGWTNKLRDAIDKLIEDELGPGDN